MARLRWLVVEMSRGCDDVNLLLASMRWKERNLPSGTRFTKFHFPTQESRPLGLVGLVGMVLDAPGVRRPRRRVVGHGRRGIALVLAGPAVRRPRGCFHLTLGVLVHESSVGWQVCRRRGVCRHGDAVTLLD